MRAAIAGLIGAQPGLSVAGSFASVADLRDARAAFDDAESLIALIDVDGPERCLDTIERFCALELDCRLVLMCTELDEEIVACGTAHAVSGVLLKSYQLVDVRAALDHIITGHVVMPAGWHAAGASESLSPRLRQVLDLLSQGLSNDEIATRLHLSPNTVKFYVRDLYQRLGVRNRIEASQCRWRLLDAAV